MDSCVCKKWCGRWSSQLPYLEPLKILSRAKKHFNLDMNGRTEIVSVYRLKKVHFECDIPNLDVVDTPNFNPLQSPLHTPTPLSSSPSTPYPQPQTENYTKPNQEGRYTGRRNCPELILFDSTCLYIYFFIVCIVHFCAVILV